MQSGDPRAQFVRPSRDEGIPGTVFKGKKGAYRRVDFTYADTVRHKTLALTNFHISFKGKSKKTHLFCAHWDCRPWADRDPDFRNRSLPIPGANDGASGTAILMELCNLLSSTPADKSVELAFFDGEDYGSGNMPEAWCLGSKHFARNVLSETYAYAVLIDMVGDKNLAIKREPQSLACAPWLISKVWALAKEQGAAGFLDKTGPSIYDDHVPLIAKGIPAIDIIDFDYPFWHTLNDTPDKCSPVSLKQVGDLLTALIYER